MRAQSVAAGGGAKGFDSASSVAEMKMVVRHRDLREIVEAIKENFDNAASAGDQVSEMLEISKAQLDRSFKQLRSMFNKLKQFLSIIWILSFVGLESELKNRNFESIKRIVLKNVKLFFSNFLFEKFCF